jgi:hypothetical protein
MAEFSSNRKESSMSSLLVPARSITEAEARAARQLRTPSPDRLQPTADDLAIFRRTVRRLMRWAEQENVKGDRRVTGAMLCDITKRAVLDMVSA